jgi:acyl phosphate:glycerol-3-phosphate acyltransferase
MPELSLPFPSRIALAFLLGAIPFAVVAMLGTGVDITKFGSGNPGFNNVLRYSKWRSIVCLVGDLGKGALAVWLCLGATDPPSLGWVYGITAIVGHCYSPFLKFNGGKGIATSAGVVLYLYPVIALASLSLYAVLRLIGKKLNWTESGTIASLSSYGVTVLILLFAHGPEPALYGFVLFLLVAWRHKKNFLIISGQLRA